MFDRTIISSLGAVSLGVVFAVLATSGHAYAEKPPVKGSKVGELYPDFLLPKVGGGWGRLSDFRKHKVVLIHFASW